MGYQLVDWSLDQVLSLIYGIRLNSMCHLHGSCSWIPSVGLEGVWVPSDSSVKDFEIITPSRRGICEDRMPPTFHESSWDSHKAQAECTNPEVSSVSNEYWHPGS